MKNLTCDYLFTLMQTYRSQVRASIDAKAISINAMHVECLMVIADKDNCTANDISQILDRDKSQISLLVKDMVSKGWINRTPNERDRRSKLLTLTETGHELISKVYHEEKSVGERMIQGLTEEELETFQRITQIMTNNLMVMSN